MENYLLVLYVTLEQEKAIRVLFEQRGWFFNKTDYQSLEHGGFMNEFQTPLLMLQAYDGSEAYQDVNTQNQLPAGFDPELPSFHGPVEADLSNPVPLKTDVPDCMSDIIDPNKPGITNISYSEKQNKGFLEELAPIDEEEHFSVVHVYVDPSDKITDHEGTSGEGESCTEPGNKQDLNGSTSSDQYELKDFTIVVGEHSINNLMNNNSEEDMLLNHDKSNCSNTKCDIRMKIERGKKAFLDKKRKKQENLKKQKVTNVNVKVQENGRVYKKQPIHCDDCNVTFTSLKRFQGHKARNGGKCVFTCEYCGKIFKYRKSKYLLHVKSAHTKERPHTCQTCGKGFVTSDKLKIHLRTHTGEKPCICEQCGKSFYSRAELSIHKDYHHISRENQEEMICDICNVTFCSKRYLMYHKKITHSEERDFPCNKCEKRFKCNSALQRHLKYMHSESREYSCQVCNKSFKTPACLRKHNLRHGGEKTFLCSYCDKGFYEKSKLLQHERIHTGEKPYQCDLCDYRCALSGNLSKHKKTHFRE